MKIKKLSIVGFKSFMDRLDVAFPQGISGIVGPNGCGKSNIVDAIRWCMGEQSPKQLRGRQMEDIIFGGAGDFKPMGMAEVSLHFENGDGSFPHAFAHETEISITRRLYRSGESEYLINRIPCRLKDIYEIFMDTGLGNKAYSIIGQGRIGSILEQKPEETRVMLEEAAGITKYRRKVEASQKKIELTEANLQRVEDIMGEVERQMRSLKRQASRAKRYKGLSEEIGRLELILYANSYHHLKEESGDRLRTTEDLKSGEMALSTELLLLQSQLETMNLELEEKDGCLAGFRKEYLGLKETVHRKESALQTLTGELKMQEELEERLGREREEIEKRLLGLREEREGLQLKIKERELAFLELEGEIAVDEKRLRTKRDAVTEIKESYEAARADFNKEANAEVGLRHESGYLQKMLLRITDSRSRLEKELSDAVEKVDSILRASDKKGLVRAATLDRLRQVEQQVAEENLACEELEHIKRRMETELKAAESALNMTQTRLSGLQSLSDNFEGYKTGVRTVMKAADLEPRRQGHILGLVADILQVEAGYEQAVEAVLGEKLQYVVVASQKDGLEAIEYLKTRAKGRGSFISLGDLQQAVPSNEKSHPFPFLRDRVAVPREQYRPLIDTMLGDTMVVEDFKAAVSAWRSNGRNQSFVTMEGDTVDRGGVISGGKLAQNPRGLLGRKREIEELKAQSAAYTKTVEELRIRLENVLSDLEEKSHRNRMLAEEKWACQDEINELDKVIFRLGQELDQMDKLSRRVKEDLGKMDREEVQHKDALSRIEEQLVLSHAQREREEASLRIKAQELEAAEREFDRFREKLVKLKGDHRLLQEERRSFLRERERLDEYTEEARQRLEKIEGDISMGRVRCAERLQAKALLEEDLNHLYHTVRDAEAAVNEADRERQVFHAKIKEEEGRTNRLRRDMEALRERINAANLEESELRFKMNSLAETVREKFGMELPHVHEQYLEEGFSAGAIQEKLEERKGLRQQLGEVNLTAISELEALEERHRFIYGQREDLLASVDSLKKAIQKINKTSIEKFKETFQAVDNKLREVFPILFNGGSAGLKLTDESRPLESGVLVEVQPPGKKISHMGLLSGGEKALVAMSLLFAIYMIKPSPFCLLDEVDAPLDEANIDRYNDLLQEIKKSSQIIMVTHSRRSMEIADRLFGITMEKAGVSKVVSVDIQRFSSDRSLSPQSN
jgi:chromosome segregation protein